MTPTLATGAVVAGSYKLTDRLGSGGMGEVWAAVHQMTGREVAIKCLRAAAYRHSDARVRFQREARAACAVDHPNVVEIIDFSEREGEEPMIVMERLRGQTLADKLEKEGALSVEATADLLLPVVSAVGTAHARGIVHRDLKPSNIFIGQRAREFAVVKVLDFGIAKWAELQEEGSALRTETGSALGTPCYMAPEQALGERTLDHRADVWALGVILYECLAGVRPVEGDNAAQVALRLLSMGIIPVEQVKSSVPPDVANLVRQMLRRDVTRRLPDLREAFTVLSRYTRVAAPEFSEPDGQLAKSDPRSGGSESRRAFAWTPLQNPALELPSTMQDRAHGTLRLRLKGRRWGALALGIGAVTLIWVASARDAADSAARASATASPERSMPAAPAPTQTLVPRAAPTTLGSSAVLDASVETKPDAGVPMARKAGTALPGARPTKKTTAAPAVAPSSSPSATSAEKRRLLAGAACEKSSDCESGKCVAYACR